MRGTVVRQDPNGQRYTFKADYDHLNESPVDRWYDILGKELSPQARHDFEYAAAMQVNNSSSGRPAYLHIDASWMKREYDGIERLVLVPGLTARHGTEVPRLWK